MNKINIESPFVDRYDPFLLDEGSKKKYCRPGKVMDRIDQLKALNKIGIRTPEYGPIGRLIDKYSYIEVDGEYITKHSAKKLEPETIGIGAHWTFPYHIRKDLHIGNSTLRIDCVLDSFAPMNFPEKWYTGKLLENVRGPFKDIVYMIDYVYGGKDSKYNLAATSVKFGIDLRKTCAYDYLTPKDVALLISKRFSYRK